jgi:hypothetical protein
MPKPKAKRCTATITINKRKVRCALPEGHETAKLPDGSRDWDRYSDTHEVRGFYSWSFCPEHVAGMMGVTIPAKTSRSGFLASSYTDKFSWEHEPGNKECPCDACQAARSKEINAKYDQEEVALANATDPQTE